MERILTISSRSCVFALPDSFAFALEHFLQRDQEFYRPQTKALCKSHDFKVCILEVSGLYTKKDTLLNNKIWLLAYLSNRDIDSILEYNWKKRKIFQIWNSSP